MIYDTVTEVKSTSIDNRMYICCVFVEQRICNKSKLWSLGL